MSSLPVLLSKHKEIHRRYVELERELADLDRQIIATARSSSKPRRKRVAQAGTIGATDVMRSMLRVMREAKDPLPPREVASRLNVTPIVARRQLIRGVRLGYVEHAGNARYRVADAVPNL